MVGAGYTGTEVTAQCQLMTTKLARRLPGLVGQRIRWILADSSSRVLSQLDKRLSNTATRVLRREDVPGRSAIRQHIALREVPKVAAWQRRGMINRYATRRGAGPRFLPRLRTTSGRPDANPC